MMYYVGQKHVSSGNLTEDHRSVQ